MRHEPRRLIGYAEHAVQLVRRHAFLAGSQQPECQQPLMYWDMRPLHDGADASGELLAALIARIPPRSHRLAAEWRNRIKDSAMRAVRTIRPPDRLKRFTRGIVIVIAGMG